MPRFTAPLVLLLAAACGGGAPEPRTLRIDTEDTYATGNEPGTDLDKVFVEAHTADAIVPADPQADGSFAARTPPGKVWVRVVDRRGDFTSVDRGDLYVLTSASEVHIGRDFPGRPGVKVSRDPATTLELDGAGLDAWQPGDSLDLAVPGTGLSRFGAFTYNSSHDPGEGDSTLGVQLKWASLPLADDSPVYLAQVRTHTTDPSGVFYASPTRGTHGQLTQVDGAETKVSFGFEPGAPLAWSADLHRSRFAALRPQIHPRRAGPAESEQLYVHAIAGGAARGELTPHGLAVLDAFYVPGDKGVDTSFALPISNPYPADWLIERYSQTFPVLLAYKDGVAQNALEAEVGFTRSPKGGVFAPQITPPRNLRLGGKLLDEDDFAPSGELSWTAPAEGTPTSYEVSVYGIAISYDLGEHMILLRRGTLFVSAGTTQIAFPHDLMQAGHPYAVCVRAVAQPGQDIETRPFRSSADRAWADACSSLLYY